MKQFGKFFEIYAKNYIKKVWFNPGFGVVFCCCIKFGVVF